MAFDFPSGASNGQTHTASNGTVYRYNGTTWLVDSANTTSAFDSRYLNTNGDGILSGSIQSQLPGGTISGSAQITTLGFVSESGDSTPAGTISGSAQITSLGFVSESFSTGGTGILSGSKTNISSLNTFTSSNNNDSLNAATSSYLTSSGSVDYTDVTSVPSNIVSGSSQLEGYVSSSSANVIEVMTSASYALITPVSGTLYIIQG